MHPSGTGRACACVYIHTILKNRNYKNDFFFSILPRVVGRGGGGTCPWPIVERQIPFCPHKGGEVKSFTKISTNLPQYGVYRLEGQPTKQRNYRHIYIKNRDMHIDRYKYVNILCSLVQLFVSKSNIICKHIVRSHSLP